MVLAVVTGNHGKSVGLDPIAAGISLDLKRRVPCFLSSLSGNGTHWLPGQSSVLTIERHLLAEDLKLISFLQTLSTSSVTLTAARG